MRQLRADGQRRAPSTGPAAGLTRRSVLSAGLLGAGAMALSACTSRVGAATAPNGADVVIGTNLELTGPNLVVGRAQWNAINIVVNRINAAGFVAGGRTRKISLLPPFDNFSEAKFAEKGMNQLVENASISVIIGAGSSALSVKMATIAEQRQVPMISLASASTITAPLSSHEYVFRLGPNAVDVAKLLADELKDDDAKRIALMYSPDAHGADGRTQMTLALNRVGLGIVHSVAVPAGAVSAGVPVTPSPGPGAGKGITPSPSATGLDATAKSDMAPQVAEIMAVSPDVVVIWAIAPMTGLVARSLRNAGYTGLLYFDSGAASSETLSAQNLVAVEGACLVAPAILGGAPTAVTTPATQDLVDFYNTYTSMYTTFDGLAPYGGDAIKLIVEAVILSGDTDRQSLRESIEQTNSYEGLAGTYTFGPTYHGGVSADSLTVFNIKHGGWVPAE